MVAVAALVVGQQKGKLPSRLEKLNRQFLVAANPTQIPAKPPAVPAQVPTGDPFRNRIAMYPEIITCTCAGWVSMGRWLGEKILISDGVWVSPGLRSWKYEPDDPDAKNPWLDSPDNNWSMNRNSGKLCEIVRNTRFMNRKTGSLFRNTRFMVRLTGSLTSSGTVYLTTRNDTPPPRWRFVESYFYHLAPGHLPKQKELPFHLPYISRHHNWTRTFFRII